MPNYTLNSIKLSGTDVVFKPVGQQSPYDGEAFNLVQDSEYINENYATGAYGHAEGSYTSAGWRSHTEGYMTFANNTSHAEGRCSIATGKGSHAEGVEYNQDLNLFLSKDAEITNDYFIVADAQNLSIGDIISIGFKYPEGWDGAIDHEPTDARVIKKISLIPNETIIGPAEGFTIPSQAPEGDPDGMAQWNSEPGYFYFSSNYYFDDFLNASFFIVKNDDDNGILYQIDSIYSSSLYYHTYSLTPPEEEYSLQEGDVLVFFDSDGYEIQINKPFKDINYNEDNLMTLGGVLPANIACVRKINSVMAIGDGSHAEGKGTKAYGLNSHAEGELSIAGVLKANEYDKDDGINTHAEGYATKALGNHSHAEGKETTSTGYASHAEGEYTIASGYGAHAEGMSTKASDKGCHAEGYSTISSKYYAHAEGCETEASGHSSHVEGRGTRATKAQQHVQGRYNIEGDYAHIVGNGSKDVPSNAHTLDWNGNAWYQGTIESAGIILTSPNGYMYKLTINDDGELNTELLGILD